MRRDKTLYSGYTGKSELMTVIKDAIGTESKFENPKVVCVAIDGMCMLHRHKLPTNTKTGNDLIAAVCSWVDKLTVGCSTVIVAFDMYLDMSVKTNTRNDRYGKSDTKKKANRHCIITLTTNISRLSMIQLLSHSKTKHSIVELLLFPLRNHLRSRGVNYVVAGNHKILQSNMEAAKNNHKETDTLLIHCLTSTKVVYWFMLWTLMYSFY